MIVLFSLWFIFFLYSQESHLFCQLTVKYKIYNLHLIHCIFLRHDNDSIYLSSFFYLDGFFLSVICFVRHVSCHFSFWIKIVYSYYIELVWSLQRNYMTCWRNYQQFTHVRFYLFSVRCYRLIRCIGVFLWVYIRVNYVEKACYQLL